jgi:uncharacterized protein YrrD
MQFTKGATVYSADLDNIGRVTHIVFKPRLRQVTHIVVRRGLFFAKDTVIPLEMFRNALPHMAALYDNAETLQDLPVFRETVYVPIEPERNSLAMEPMGNEGGLYVNAPANQAPKYVKQVKQNVPDDALVLRTGAHVISEDQHMLGRLYSVEVDSQTHHMTHISVSQGLLWKTYRRFPAFWCQFVDENQVIVPAKAATLNALETYYRTEG